MKNVNLLSYQDVVELAQENANAELVLHWEGQDGVKTTTAWTILDDIKEGEYTVEQFEEYGYCLTPEEYKRSEEY